MKIKKRTKRIIKYIVIIFMIISMLLPMVANLFNQNRTEQVYLNSQNEKSEEDKNKFENIPEIEGSYQVVDVPSGDTLKILWGNEERNVKLIGIEEVLTTKKTLKRMVANDFVLLEFDVIEEDDKNNLLAYVYQSDGRFINRELILFGNAKVNTDISKNKRYLDELKDAQIAALNNQVGCWSKNGAQEENKK